MVLEWTSEERTLLNIKKIIAAVWRMDRQQMYFYYRRMLKKQSEILPGQLGIVFLKKLKWIADRETDTETKIWPDLMKDAERVLKLIQENQNNQDVWLVALTKLEVKQDCYFKTELGRAFILVLKDKLEICLPEKSQEHNQKVSSVNTGQTVIISEKKELEKIAVWLMKDLPEQGKIVKRIKVSFFQQRMRQTAIPIFTCLSICCMVIWMYGQISRNMDRWNLQQMKVSSVQKTDVFIEDSSGMKTEAVNRSVKLKDTGQLVEKVTLQNKPKKKHPEKLKQYKEMSEEYPHLYGWLQIPGTQIDFPVMRTESDRDFYLYHDFSGAESAEGALFVDAESSIYPQDGNTVVYGHNMKNGHMFGTLKMYGDADFFQDHRKIQFDTLYETGVYEAVAVLKTRILNENEQGFRYYQFFNYENEEEFQECQEFVEENRLFEMGSTLQYGDRVLMLSTCEYSQENGRLVVVARKMFKNPDDSE